MFGSSTFNRNPSNAKLMPSRHNEAPLASPFGSFNNGRPSVSPFGSTNSGTSFASVLGPSSNGTASISPFGSSSSGTPSVSPFGLFRNGTPSISPFGSPTNAATFGSSSNGKPSVSPFGSFSGGTPPSITTFASSTNGTPSVSPFRSSSNGVPSVSPFGSASVSPFGLSSGGTPSTSHFGFASNGTSGVSPFGLSTNGTPPVSPFGLSRNGTSSVSPFGLSSSGTPISPFGFSSSATPSISTFGLSNNGTPSGSQFRSSTIGNSGFQNGIHGSIFQQTESAYSMYSQPNQSYNATSVDDQDNKGNISKVLMQSICGMPVYKDKSHDELRFENYQAKGGVKNTNRMEGGFGPIFPTSPLNMFSTTSVTDKSNTQNPSPNFFQNQSIKQAQYPSPNFLQNQLTTQTQNPSPNFSQNQSANQTQTAGLFRLNVPPVPYNSTTNAFPSENPFTSNPVTMENSVSTSQISPCPPAPEILPIPNFCSNRTVTLSNVPSTNPSVQQNMTSSPSAEVTGGDTTGSTEAVPQLCIDPFRTTKVLQPSVDCQRSSVSNQYGISSRPVSKCVLN